VRGTHVGALAGLIVALVVAGCGAKKDPLEVLLADLEEAAEDRDASRIEGRLAEDFSGSGRTTRADVGALLRRYFAAYETVNLEVYDVTIERQEASARLTFRVDFNGRPLQLGGLAGFLPPAAMYRLDLGLRREGDDWRVASASWEEVVPTEPGV
jgi:hypothetical protein